MNFIGSDTDVRPGTLADPGDEGRAHPPQPIKISHKKHDHQRRPQIFHVSCPHPVTGSATGQHFSVCSSRLSCNPSTTFHSLLCNSWIFFTFSEQSTHHNLSYEKILSNRSRRGARGPCPPPPRPWKK